MNNEIMNNEIMETTEDVIANAGMNNVINIAAGVGTIIVAGVAAYKYIVKPIAVKIKDKIDYKKKMAEIVEDDVIYMDESDFEVEHD